ncbi:MAG: STAS domain-containing protein [Planctomycetes bacterium]|nr:STAS domain-containing protein [Planctomycetota bacterium]
MTSKDLDSAFTPPAASALVSFRTIGGTLFATITAGAISSIEVGTIRETLRQALEQAPKGLLRHFVLDLEAVTFVNSEAIGMFVAMHSASEHRGATLILAAVTKPVLEVLVATHLQRVLTICTSPHQLEEALR